MRGQGSIPAVAVAVDQRRSSSTSSISPRVADSRLSTGAELDGAHARVLSRQSLKAAVAALAAVEAHADPAA